ncbi:MAG: hypothetical protein DRQ55_07530 [Planctomycetota bacterium]|nr:MAG: hypothetical protein DRQ55_07530 [Planctomycetota bacterium]
MLRGGRIGRESGRLAQARELVQLGSVRGALDLGMTATIAVRTEQRPDERLILLVHRPPDDGALALHLALLEDGAAGAHESWQQALIAAAPMRGGESVLIQLPLENGCGMLMFELSVAPPRSGDLAHRVQVDRARSQASAHLTGLRRMLEQVRAGVPDQTGVIAALAGLKSDEARRAALLHVAAIADAGATRDLALTGRPDLLHEVADGLSQRIPQGYDPTIEELAWLCEQESLTAAARRVESEVDEPVLEALLLRHTGEVGRNLPLVLGLLDAADGLSDLRARLLAENLLYLDDTSPASRVRAFDWLLLRGLHPQDYNPLGSRVERRAALARHVEAAGDAP